MSKKPKITNNNIDFKKFQKQTPLKTCPLIIQKSHIVKSNNASIVLERFYQEMRKYTISRKEDTQICLYHVTNPHINSSLLFQIPNKLFIFGRFIEKLNCTLA